MKIYVRTLKNTNFQIDVNPQDTVGDMKKLIETMQDQGIYPAEQQMLIFKGKVLKDESTLDENKIVENDFIVIMLSKTKASSSGGSNSTSVQVNQPPPKTVPATLPPGMASSLSSVDVDASAPPAIVAPTSVPASSEADPYGQAASNLVSANSLENNIQQILEMGGGSWDRDTVARALHAAYNNPDRAIDYLYSGFPQDTEDPPVSQAPAFNQAINPTNPVQQAVEARAPAGPNANPLNLFPQVLPRSGDSGAGLRNLDSLRSNPQFRDLLSLVQSNTEILQPLLQELGKQNPQVLQLIQENPADFLRMINESGDGEEGDLLEQYADAEADPDEDPHSIEVTPEENEAIERLEAMGFDRDAVLEVFFACNRDEELAANYLLDHMNEFDDGAAQ